MNEYPQQHVEAELSRLNHAVFGNGEPGIRTSLAVLAEQQNTVDGRLTKIESHLSKITWLIVASVVTALLKLVMS